MEKTTCAPDPVKSSNNGGKLSNKTLVNAHLISNYMLTDACDASILRGSSRLLLAGYLLSSLFDPDDGDDMIF
jgi:hypothetical protein